MAAHAVDVSVFAALIHLTDGPTSPFFVFLTFAVFSAAVQWSWRGASVTTVITSVMYIVLSVAAVGPIHDLNRVVIRCLDLLLAGSFLTYLSAILENANLRLKRLADWPRPNQEDSGEYPDIGRAIAHAAGAIGANGLLVMWQPTDEPVAHKARYNRGSVRFETVQAGLLGGAPNGRFATEPGDGQVKPEERVTKSLGRQVIGIAGGGFNGSLRFMDFRPSTEGRLVAEIAARQIGGEIERHILQQQLITAVALRERERMAEDIHDDLLQSLAAMALQLKALESMVPDKVHAKIGDINNVVEAQQARLRELIVRIRETQSEPSLPRHPTLAVSKEIGDLLKNLEMQWGCATMLYVDPHDAEIPSALGADIVLVVTEAVANAVKHGNAMYVEIMFVVRERMLSITISDDGVSYGKEQVEGGGGAKVETRAGSSSIRRRIASLGGNVHSSSAPDGFQVKIEIPVRQQGLPGQS
jgi:signal transduction histidine kinase